MKKCFELSKAQGLGNIYKTPCGVINVNVRGVTLHLTKEQFVNLSWMFEQASKELFNSELEQLMNG